MTTPMMLAHRSPARRHDRHVVAVTARYNRTSYRTPARHVGAIVDGDTVYAEVNEDTREALAAAVARNVRAIGSGEDTTVYVSERDIIALLPQVDLARDLLGPDGAHLGRALDVARAHVRALGDAITAQHGHVTVYTDGSVRRGHRGCGLGAVCTDGTVTVGYLDAPGVPALAELAAIRMAAIKHRRVDLTIRTDSQRAVELLSAPLPPITGSIGVAGRKIRELVRDIDERRRGRSITVEWVRGHAGDLHNEFADRAAVAGRRCADANCDDATARRIVEQIRTDHAAAAAARRSGSDV